MPPIELSHALDTICARLSSEKHARFKQIVAIDGRCAAGKTTLAAHLAARLHCPVFHMDDFFLRPEQRNAERLATHGENVDHERFLAEVLLPLAQGLPTVYRPYDCHTQSLGQAIALPPCSIAVVEGSYACHPSLYPHYTLRVFLDVEKETQKERLLLRNGREGLAPFLTRWIPLEEAYFSALCVKERCDLSFSLA